jgi:hypothetical protein
VCVLWHRMIVSKKLYVGTVLAKTEAGVTSYVLRIADTVVELALIAFTVAAAVGGSLVNLRHLIPPTFAGLRPCIVLTIGALALGSALFAGFQTNTVLFLAVAFGACAVNVHTVNNAT